MRCNLDERNVYSAALKRLTVMSSCLRDADNPLQIRVRELAPKSLSNKRSAAGVREQTNDAGSAIIRHSHAAPSQRQLLLYSGRLNVDSSGSSCLSGV